MDIYDIPVAEITKQYVACLDLMKELNLDIAGDYLIIAAELARIKSKHLLPIDSEVEDLDEDKDPRDELTRRLLEYQRYKDAAFELRKKEYDRQQVFTRRAPFSPEVDDELAPGGSNVFDLLVAFQKLMKVKSFSEEYEIKITTLSVSDRLESVLDILNVSRTITFESLFTPLNTKEEMIVTFLALLELIRLKLVKVEQTAPFEALRLYLDSDKEDQLQAINFYRESEELNKEI